MVVRKRESYDWIYCSLFDNFWFLPQMIKVLKTKDVESISLGMYTMSVSGMALWLAHGISVSDPALIVANTISVALAGIILICKIIYK